MTRILELARKIVAEPRTEWIDPADARELAELVLAQDKTDILRPAGKLFQVIEYQSFFAVRHLPSGAECPMGDCVDALFRDDEEEGSVALSPGTEGFVQEWTDSLNANPQETLEAYFPELVDQPEEDEEEEQPT